MAIAFPSSPSTGQVFTVGNRSWTWDGSSWKGGVSSSGDATTLDSIDSTQFLRSDADDSITGQIIFPSTNANKPVFPQGLLARADQTDTAGFHDIWGISERYYPSNSTAADAWGIRWSGTPNEIQFIGSGTEKFKVDLDTGAATATSFIGDGSNLTGLPAGYTDANVITHLNTKSLYFNGGNIGIGTNNPQQLLHIHNSSGDFSAEAVLTGRLSTGTPKAEVAFKRGTSGDGAMLVLRPSNGSGSLIDAVTIKDGTGNVGIGTTSPSAKLHVDQGHLFFNKTMPVASPGTDFDFIKMQYGGGWSGNQGGLASIAATDGTGVVGRFGVTYRTGSGDTGGSFVVSDLYQGGYGASGEVFEVNNDRAIIPSILNFSNTKNSSLIQNTSGGVLEIRSDNQMEFFTYSGSWQKRMVIADGGNVGIGTNSPLAKLHIQGNAVIGDIQGYETTHPGESGATLHIHDTVADGGTNNGQVNFGDETRVVISTGAEDGGGQGYQGSLWFGTSDHPAGGNTLNAGTQWNYYVAGIASKTTNDTGSQNVSFGNLEFYTKGSNSTSSAALAMTISESQNVGIGTDSPAEMLHVNYTSGRNTVALLGSVARGIYFTSDNAIISKGTYFDNGWIATDTELCTVDMDDGGFTFRTKQSGNTAGQATSLTSAYERLKIEDSRVDVRALRLKMPVGTSDPATSGSLSGDMYYNSSTKTLKIYDANDGTWNNVYESPIGDITNPITTSNISQFAGNAGDMYYVTSPTSGVTLQLEYSGDNYKSQGRGYFLAWEGGHTRAQVSSILGQNFYFSHILIDAVGGPSTYHTQTFSALRPFNTSSDTTTAASGTRSGYRLYLGGAGSHGIYNTAQSPCNWGSSAGAFGSGYDGSCGTYPSGLRMGDGTGGPTYTNYGGDWYYWIAF